MSKPMFAIVASGGSYDDAWSRAEYVTDDEDKGRAYCEKMNALSEAVKSANIQYTNWQQHYMMQNPRVGPTPYTVLDVPKWNSGNKVTQEMRDERKRIQDINIANQQAANKPMIAYSQAMYAAQQAYKATLPEDIQLGMQNSYHDTFWEIEPINWLE
jgi:hypothetical protein